MSCQATSACVAPSPINFHTAGMNYLINCVSKALQRCSLNNFRRPRAGHLKAALTFLTGVITLVPAEPVHVPRLQCRCRNLVPKACSHNTRRAFVLTVNIVRPLHANVRCGRLTYLPLGVRSCDVVAHATSSPEHSFTPSSKCLHCISERT